MKRAYHSQLLHTDDVPDANFLVQVHTVRRVFWLSDSSAGCAVAARSLPTIVWLFTEMTEMGCDVMLIACTEPRFMGTE